MKVQLLFRDREASFDLGSLPTNPYARFEPRRRSVTEVDLIQDLELSTLLDAMAQGDDFLREVASQAILQGLHNDADTILYRQAVLNDVLRNSAVVRSLYELVMSAIEDRHKRWWGIFNRDHPASTLYSAVHVVRMFIVKLEQLKSLAGQHADDFESEGLRGLFSMLERELSDDYCQSVLAHLDALEFKGGVLLSARLGEGNSGTGYALREQHEQRGWIKRLLNPDRQAYSFQLHPRDEAGARALSDLRDRGVNDAANAVAQSADHILGFFGELRTELAFYLGCVNLHVRLGQQHVPNSFPVPMPCGTDTRHFDDLRDASLALTTQQPVVGNDLHGNNRNLVIITGANQGGKSTFLRAIGLAQLMMQAGMFVAAASFEANVCTGVFTHYKREEDSTMESGKFDEELARMSQIVDTLQPHPLVLLNESFAATNEREGSEVAQQIVRGLLTADATIFYVTHLHEFAARLHRDHADTTLFLRAERQPGGTRTYRIMPGAPLETSYGEDLYHRIFGTAAACKSPVDGAPTSADSSETSDLDNCRSNNP